MVEAPGIAVAPQDAEATRRRLQAEGILRIDLRPARHDGQIVFPVDAEAPTFTFAPREDRPARYQDLLPEAMREEAPRAFDALGDIAIIKIPESMQADAEVLGDALLRFQRCRAVFHDAGVVGTFRVRDLRLIAGTGSSETAVVENGVRLHVDPGAAYYSPRLGQERARCVSQVTPGEHVVDLFGGVAPFGIQAAKAGAVVDSVDLNPAAVALARRNIEANHVDVAAHEGDAREVAARLEPADRIMMNLPHGAWDFLDVAWRLLAPGGTIHYHEILEDDEIPARREALHRSAQDADRKASVAQRVVRTYATTMSHMAFDVVTT